MHSLIMSDKEIHQGAFIVEKTDMRQLVIQNKLEFATVDIAKKEKNIPHLINHYYPFYIFIIISCPNFICWMKLGINW